MSAGLTKKQIATRIRYRLHRIQRDLEAAGVQTTLKHGQITADQNRAPHAFFGITYSVSRASNGEVGGFPQLYLPSQLLFNGHTSLAVEHDEHYGTNMKNGTFERGIARLKELFGAPALVNPSTGDAAC